MKEKVELIIKKFDYIGKTFNFRYKSYENYRSLTGGIFFIFFLILTLIFSFINLNDLIRRQNKSINNFNTIISPTDTLNFLNHSFSLGFSVSCNKYDESKNTPLSELFGFDFVYVTRLKDENSVKTRINLHSCNYSDFNSDYIQSSEINKFINSGYYCPDNLNHNVTGIFEDNFFSYYEVTIYTKKTDNFDIYYQLLSNYDCKAHYLLSPIAFDLSNYSHPLKSFLTDTFIQINPLAYIKRNVFFKINEFQSSNNLIALKYNKKYLMDYSRFDEYLLYKPKERFENQVYDFESLISIYFRADNERSSISRKYKTLPEYSSEVFTGLSVIYIIVFLFVSIVNNFYANHSIMKEFFQFKKTEKRSNDIFPILKQKFSESRIQRLSKMSKIAEFGNFGPGELEEHSLFVKIKANKKNSTGLNQFQISPFFSSNENINNYNTKDNNKDNNKDINKDNNKDINNNNTLNSNNDYSVNSNIKLNSKGNQKKFGSTHFSFASINHIRIKNNLINNEKEKDNFPLSNKDIHSCYSPSKIIRAYTKKKNIKKEKKIKLDYSIIEIIISIFCPLCSNSQLEIKNKLLEKAKYKLFSGLDILTYLRNLQRTEYLNFILLEPYQNILLGYMTKPSISLDYQFDVFEHLKLKYNPDFNGKDIEEFLKSYHLLSEIKNKTTIDTRLYNIVNIELENLCVE